LKVLVLNQNYVPMGICEWERAVNLMFDGKIEVLETYNKEIRSPSVTIKMPAVIRVLKFVKAKKLNVRFNKKTIWSRDGGKCQYCSRTVPEAKGTLDHVLPKSKGGTTDFHNIVLSCYNCNSKKGHQTLEESKMQLKTTPHKPEGLWSFKLELVATNVPEQWARWVN
jgi:5-methylcytosine-specific restriction endonuclease McrA